jgi:AcrR family transcriptional regulator
MAGETARRAAPKAKARVRRARDSLSREVIIEAAETIALRDGLDGLTFKAIGDELDAHPTSVYRHFRDKDELVLELIDTLRAKSYGGTVKPSADWRDDLRRLGQAIHAHYLRYPEFALHMAARTTRRPTEFANVELALDALRRAGLDDDEAVICTRVLGNFLRSLSSIQAALQALPPQTRTADELAWHADYRHLSAEEYPNIARLGDKLTGIGDPRVFDEGLEMILDSIEARAERSRARRAAEPA